MYVNYMTMEDMHEKYILIKMVTVWLILFSTEFHKSVTASHTIGDQYSGSGYVSKDTVGQVEDTDGNIIGCAFSGTTYVDIVWKWRNVRPDNPGYYFTWGTTKVTIGSHLSSSTLFFNDGLSDVDKKDASGVIYAEGEHDDDPNVKITCNDVSLTIIWKPEQPSLSINKNRFIFGEDSTAQLTCQPTDKGNPEGQVRWSKNENLQSESEYNTEMIGISVTKDMDGDKWQCYYYNTAGNGDYSDEIMINVIWKPEQPSLSINKDPLIIGEDTTAQLNCQLTDKGNPEDQVQWVRNRNLQSQSEYNTQTITISVTKDMDGDKWKCYYYNTAGDGDYSIEVMTNVNWSPGGASISADTDIPKLDDTLTFTCTGDRGNPQGRVLWYLDMRLVANTNSKQHTVSGVNESHNGNWDCMFKNYLNDGARSQSIQIKILCLPSVHIDYITYEFTPGYVNFNLKTKNAFAASTLEVSVCSLDDSPFCNIAKSNIEHTSNLEQSVGLPESSDGAVYNVTFTFSNNYRYIVTQHGIALKGTVVQSQVPVILAALFGTLLMLAIVTIITLVYVFHWRNKATGTNVQSENSVHYVNVGSEGNSGGITHIQATPEYEDVNTAATNNGQSSNIGNATYMDLDQSDIQQTRNRPAEVTVYQSLN